MDGALAMISQHEVMLHMRLFYLIHICIPLLYSFLQILKSLAFFLFLQDGGLMYLGEEQGIHIADFFASNVLRVIVGLYFSALQLAELFGPFKKFIIMLMHDLVH